MTNLELTEWVGVDQAGPFLLMFGGITGSGEGATLTVTRILPDGRVVGRLLCTQVDASTFTISEFGEGVPTLFIDNISTDTCTWSITDDILTLTMGSVVSKVKRS